MNGRNAARDRLQVHAGATGEIGKGVELEHACTGEIAGGQDVHAGFSRVIWRW